jgi:uncharacterized lipoprotein YmbA
MKQHVALPLAAAVLLGSGCSSAPERYYTLLPEVSTPARGSAAPTRSLVVEPVALPPAEDRPQLVVEVAAQQRAVLEQERWIEPLSADLQRALAARLAAALEDTDVRLAGDRGANGGSLRLTVQVRRFELSPDRGARLEAHWMIRGADQAALREGDFVRVAPAGSRSYPALVQAQSASVGALGEQLAAVLRELR